ncbi:MAG: hypothetical protein ACOYNI_10910, partial [Acidimicrobiia bacterium]
MLTGQARRLGEFLVERHVLSRDELEVALAEARKTQEPLPALLMRRRMVSEKDLKAAIADTLAMRFVDFEETPLHPDAAAMLPPEVARAHEAIGVDFEGAKLVVAFADPGNDSAIAAVGAATGY